MEGAGDDGSLSHQIIYEGYTSREGGGNFIRRKRADTACHQPAAQIIVRLEAICRHPGDGRMAWNIHRIGDEGRRSIGNARAGGQHRHRIGDAERERPPPRLHP